MPAERVAEVETSTTESVKPHPAVSAHGDRFSMRPSHLIPAALLAITLFVTSMAVGGSGAQANATEGVLFGAASGLRGTETHIEAISELEDHLGTTLPIVRRFRRWEDSLNTTYHRWLVDGGRKIHLSIKPTRANGQRVLWRDIANAKPGSQIHNEIVEMADQINQLDGEIWMTFHHEPEAGDEASGSSAEFQAAWRNFRSIFEDQGVDTTWVLTMTGWSYEVRTSDVRSIQNWYPGDAHVDIIGADIYNWSNCRTKDEGWRSLESKLEGVIAFADSKGKKVALPEFGSDEGASGAKGAWLDEVRTLMKDPYYSSRFAAIMYFDTMDPSVPNCDWLLESSPQSLAAAGRIARDPFFRSRGTATSPTSTAAPAPQPTQAPTTVTQAPEPEPAVTPQGSCTVRTLSGSDQITWTSQGGNFGYNLRRNDKWVANVQKNTSFTNAGVTSGSYQVVARGGAELLRLNCTRISSTSTPTTTTTTAAPVSSADLATIAPVGGCRVDRINGSDRVTWPIQGSGFRYEVYHDGSKIAATPNTWHWNRNVTSGSYVVKGYQGDGVATLECLRRN